MNFWYRYYVILPLAKVKHFGKKEILKYFDEIPIIRSIATFLVVCVYVSGPHLTSNNNSISVFLNI